MTILFCILILCRCICPIADAQIKKTAETAENRRIFFTESNLLKHPGAPAFVDRQTACFDSTQMRPVSAAIHSRAYRSQHNFRISLSQRSVGSNLLEFQQVRFDTGKKMEEQTKAGFYLGGGWVSGVRIGAFVVIIKNLSLEVSYGKNLSSFVALGTARDIYALGVNYHEVILPNLTVSAILAHKVIPGQSFVQSNYVSMNVGYLPFEKRAVRFFIRAGIYIEREINYVGRFYHVGPNLDFGIAINVL